MIQPKTRKQIAEEYGISAITLRRKIRAFKLQLPSGNLLPAYQKVLYESLGYPKGVDCTLYRSIPVPTSIDSREG